MSRSNEPQDANVVRHIPTAIDALQQVKGGPPTTMADLIAVAIWSVGLMLTQAIYDLEFTVRSQGE